MQIADLRCRSVFYTALGRLLLINLGEDEDKFEQFMMPLTGKKSLHNHSFIQIIYWTKLICMHHYISLSLCIYEFDFFVFQLLLILLEMHLQLQKVVFSMKVRLRYI